MDQAIDVLKSARQVLVIQGENPDGDSLASALALEAVLGEQGKQIYLYCAVEMPRYLRYLSGWDRVSAQLPPDWDAAVLVDASTAPLIQRLLTPANIRRLGGKPFVIIDHHAPQPELAVKSIDVIESAAVSTGQIIYGLIKAADWSLSASAAGMLAASILSDSLGLSSPKTTADSIRILADLVDSGADLNQLDEARRELNRKSLDIFRYKGQLFERVELALDNRLAMVTIPWEEIAQYSDAYNPSMLIIDEMRLIDGVSLAAAFKTYPDGKVTAKLRANSDARFMDQLAEHFGGGGHPFAAGFKVLDTPFETLKTEFISVVKTMLEKPL